MSSIEYSLPMKKRKVTSIEDFAPHEDLSMRKMCKAFPDKILSRDVTQINGSLLYDRHERNSIFQQQGNLFIDPHVTPIHPVYTHNLFYPGNVPFCGLRNNHVLFPIVAREDRTNANLHNPPSSKKKDDKPKVFNKWWKIRYQELVEFKKNNGHCHVPQRYLANKSLGKWVHKQRQECRKLKSGESTSLTPARIEALKSIGFQCTPNNKAESLWQTRFNELKDYKKLHGDCRVPQNYGPNKPLGKWVHRQRHEFKKMVDRKDSQMSRDRFEALSSVDFYFNAKELLWKRRLNDLGKFRSTHGHCDVKADGPTKSLGLWLIRQKRILTKNTKNEVSKQTNERRMVLESMGVNLQPFQSAKSR